MLLEWTVVAGEGQLDITVRTDEVLFMNTNIASRIVAVQIATAPN
jgi:hypothetical protein